MYPPHKPDGHQNVRSLLKAKTMSGLRNARPVVKSLLDTTRTGVWVGEEKCQLEMRRENEGESGEGERETARVRDGSSAV